MNDKWQDWKPGDKCACGAVLYLSLDITGGCRTDHGEDYCYCDSEDIFATVRCPTWSSSKKVTHTVDFTPKGLTDRWAIQRWINNGGLGGQE